MNERLPGWGTVSGRILAVPLVLLLVSGCMRVEKPDHPPEALRDAIRGGELVQPGDRVAVTSVGGGEQVLVVAGIDIDNDTIRGAGAEIPIEEVTALEKREFSPVRTGLAGLGVSAVVVIAVATSVFLGFIAGL